MSHQKFALKTLLISMAAAMSVQASAQELKKTELPRIDVVGTADNAVAKQPGSVAIVTKEELELRQPMSTQDALRNVPGVVIKPEEESAVVANIGVRGLSAADYKTLILEDGVPVAPSLFLGNARYYNPRIQRMESVEVLKGASSLRYGPSTIGGVINYKTKQPEDGASVAGRVGSHGYKEATVEAGGSAPSGDAVAGIVYTKAESDGFQDKGFIMNDLMVKGGMAIGNDQWVSAKFTHYDNEANISYRGLFLDAYKDGATYNPAPDDYFLTERNSFDINHEWDISDQVKLNTLVYWSEMSRDYWRFSTDNTASKAAGRWVYTDEVKGNNRAFERTGLDTRLSVAHNTFGIQNETEMGLRLMNESMVDKGITASRSSPRSGTLTKEVHDSAKSVAVYAQNRFMVNDQLAITPGIRIEQYEQESVNERNRAQSASTDNTEVMPGVGVTYQVSPAAQVFGGVYKAFAPAVTADALTGYEDQQLEAERSVNYEIGVRGAVDTTRYELAAFQMNFENQIIPANSNSDFQKTNGGKTLHQGIEAALGFELGGGFSLDTNVTYVANAQYVGNRYKANGDLDIADGNRVTYTPEWIMNASLGYKNGGLNTALSANHMSAQFTDTANTKEIAENTSGFFTGQVDAYTTLDLNAHYTVDKQLSVFGAVKNLTDERYIASLRQGIYAGPDRSFELGAKYKF
ncbi:TonB-dependent receptor family protein [Thiomicrorhabdus aquaedulcis]|uniref:TonB-dependent receptor family protein n=1 Tax=Thiomicrorhabdus aquaedulcis TaxID=2211106 RepID=UPI000FD917DE|nr:TonB-dependent receptor [Thiomicrorhabdus aquaedulcis]